MNFIKTLWSKILALDNQPLHNKIKDLETENMDLESKLNTEIDNYNYIKEHFMLMQSTKNKLLDEIDELKFQYDLLKNSLAEPLRPDLDIDYTKKAYTEETIKDIINIIKNWDIIAE